MPIKVEDFLKERRDISKAEGKNYGLCPDPTSDKEALDVLKKHFIPNNWYITIPVSGDQANTEMVAYILENFPNKDPLYKRILNKIKNLFTRGK